MSEQETTQAGYRYWVTGRERNWKVTEDGHIARTDLDPHARPYGQWYIVAAVRYNNFGRVVEVLTWKDLRAAIDRGEDLTWLYKNGRQRWHIRDFDHGAIREWASPTGYRVVSL